MPLKFICSRCASGPCPTIYLDTDSGNLVVQGFKVDQTRRAGIAVPEHEDVVEIPRDLIDLFLASSNPQNKA